jgi:MFS transporter, putative metabolite:H+ symporter
VLKPAATEAAVFPAFMLLACFGLATGLAFTFLGRETHRKAVPQDAEASAPAAVPVATTPGASLDRNGAL